MATLPLAHSEEELESWDSDADLDFDLPPGVPLLASLPATALNQLLGVPGLNVSTASLSGSSEGGRSPGEGGEEEEGGGFFEELDRRLVEREGDGRSREEENESSISTTGTLTGLIGGLSLEADNEGDRTLSFSSPPGSPPQPPAGLSSSTTSTLATPRPPSKMTTLRPSSALSTLLSSASSSRGKVTHLGSTAPGRALEVADGDWDQDLDLGSLGLPTLASSAATGAGGGEREVVKKASFASHLSLDSELDDDLPTAPSGARRKLSIASVASIASFSDAADEDFDEGFDLPPSQSHLTLAAPLLATRSSLASLRSVGSSPSAPPLSPVPKAATLPSSAPPPAPAAAEPDSDGEGGDGDATEREDGDGDAGEDSDSDFFADLVLPSYFGGADGPPPESPSSASASDGGKAFLSTPPTSEGEPDSDSPQKPSTRGEKGEKVDLQQLLRAKLEQRGGRGLLFRRDSGPGSPGAAVEDERLEKHRERPEEAVGHAELAKEPSPVKPEAEKHDEGAEEEKWTAAEMRERMRTISGARAREAQLAREARLAGRTRTMSGLRGGAGAGLRRTMSEGKVPPVPALPPTRRPTAPARSATAMGPPPPPPSRLARPSSAQSDHHPHHHPHPRPPSSASNASSSGTAPPSRRGPPPLAPSAASNRSTTSAVGRMRTISLRTVGSSSDLRSAAGGMRRTGRLDVPPSTSRREGSEGEGVKRSLSPVPVTPTTPSSAVPRPTLRTKRSQQLLSTTSAASSTTSGGARTIERKRSLQSLTALPPSTPSSSSSARPGSRQTTTSFSRRSPSPSFGGAAGGRTPSFAAPTASSASRIRERVQSNPPAPPSPLIPPSPTPASGSGGFSASSASFGLTPLRRREGSAASVGSGGEPSSSSSSSLLRPTAASAAKTRPTTSSSSHSRPTSPLKPSLTSPSPSSTSRPPPSSLPITLSAPLRHTRLPAPLSLSRRHSATKSTQLQPPQKYGDGTELDAFDDLPVSKERERERVVSVSASASARGGEGRSASFGSTTSRKSSGASTKTVTPGSSSSGGNGGSWGRKNAAAAASTSLSRLPLPSASGINKPGTVRSKKEASSSSVGSTATTAAAASSRLKGKGKSPSSASIKERDKDQSKAKKAPTKKRREPHLIRHLGGAGAGVKVQNGMTYNPLLHRWEGNERESESIFRDFDVALATSTRPALISPFSSTLGSPARGGFSPNTSPPPSIREEEEKPSKTSGRAAKLPAGAANPSASRAGVKVVGDMVFDPSTCSWHAIGGQEAEEELELDWGAVTSGGEADEEGEDVAEGLDGWEKGERERMLRNRASFVLEEGGSSEEDDLHPSLARLEGGGGGEEEQRRKGKATKRRMWRESKAAEERVKGEMQGWVVREGEGGEVGGRDGRRWLWELRGLIVNPQ